MSQTLEYIQREPAVLDIPANTEVLAVWAHPDDEFLIGGLLEELRLDNIATHVIVASDGEASDRGDPDYLSSLGRRYEAGVALTAYGIQEKRQSFLGLPDSRLSEARNLSSVAHFIGRRLAQHTIRTVITLGADGYDGHDDHIATHQAAAWAVSAYAAANPNVRLLGLARQEADYKINANPALKLGRLAFHRSQFTIDLSNPSYQPTPGSLEQPGIRLSATSQSYLRQYQDNLHTEHYAEAVALKISG